MAFDLIGYVNSQQQMEVQKRGSELQDKKIQLEVQKMQREQIIQQGGIEAMKIGGMSGAIDYYKKVDLKYGADLENMVADTQNKMLSAIGIRAENKDKQMKALQHANEILGASGAMIAQQPVDQQEAVYQKMLPQLKALNPTLPKSYTNDAKIMFVGHQALATPLNHIYELEKESRTMQTDIGKIISDMSVARSRGIPDSGPEMNALKGKLSEASDIAKEAKAAAVQAKLSFERGGEDTLRKEYISLTKDFQLVQNSIGKVKESFKLGTAAGDFAGIFATFHVFDPNSTVREGEFASVKNAGGVPEWVRTLYNSALDGQLMTPKKRAQFSTVAQKLYDVQEKSYSQLRNEYSRMALERGLDPARVIPEFRTAKDRSFEERIKSGPYPDDLKQKALMAIKQKRDPQKVLEMLDGIMQKQQDSQQGVPQ